MEIEINRLSPEIVDDYFYFFDHVAFTDGSDWAGCYCVWYHLADDHEAERVAFEDAHKGESYNRVLAKRLIRDGIIAGYLAYADGAVVGWCNVNDKTRYDRLSKEKCPELWEDASAEDKAKSVVCFTIAPNMRRRGVATALLEKACDDAAKEGYSYIEAYPSIGEVNERSYHGPLFLYQKLGFIQSNTTDDFSIVRKYLE